MGRICKIGKPRATRLDIWILACTRRVWGGACKQPDDYLLPGGGARDEEVFLKIHPCGGARFSSNERTEKLWNAEYISRAAKSGNICLTPEISKKGGGVKKLLRA